MIDLMYEDIYDLTDDDLDYDDDDFDQETATMFANDMHMFLEDLINLSDVIGEEFVSNKCLRDHFYKHCMASRQISKSKKSNILYDFTDASQYYDYDKFITDEFSNTKYRIASLYDYDTILKCMRKLFEGNVTVTFCNSCGLQSSGKIINLSLHAFSDSTSNYESGNTVDICVKNARGRTITLYPVGSYYLENKLNNIVQKYSTVIPKPDSYKFNY